MKTSSPYSYDEATFTILRDGIPAVQLVAPTDSYLPAGAVHAMARTIILPALDAVGFGGKSGFELLGVLAEACREAFDEDGTAAMVSAESLRDRRRRMESGAKAGPKTTEPQTMEEFLEQLETLFKDCEPPAKSGLN